MSWSWVFVCAQCFFHLLGMIIMMEITDGMSLIFFIIICIFVLEYQVWFSVFALLEAPPRCLVIQDSANTQVVVRAV